MSTRTDADTSGYIRFPRAWMALSISPGAKCLLLHFCGAADAAGASWYSYAQLGAILQRSRSSIAAYVAELRDAGLIAATRQKTANGFNYRLRIRILGWASIVADWRKRSDNRLRDAPPERPRRQPIERRVQPTERKNPSGSRTNLHQTDSQAATPAPERSPSVAPADAPVFGDAYETAWRRLQTSGARPDAPADAVLQAVLRHADALETYHDGLDATTAEQAARAALTDFAARRRIDAAPCEIDALAQVLARRAPTRAALSHAVAALDAQWPAHWRRLSTPDQLERWLAGWLAAEPALAAAVSTLWQFRNRALVARSELHRRAQRARGAKDDRPLVAPLQMAAQGFPRETPASSRSAMTMAQ
jgi:hypothetical protein